jgi:hypothetical protein
MDKFEIRRLNLRYIIEKDFGGNASAFARNVHKDATYINRCLYEKGKKGKKNIGDEILEAIYKYLKYPYGWLEAPHWNEINEPLNSYIDSYAVRKELPAPPKTEVISEIVRMPVITWTEYCKEPGSINNIRELEFMAIDHGINVSQDIYAIDVDKNIFKEFKVGTRILIDKKKIPEKNSTVVLSIDDGIPTLVRWNPGLGFLQVEPLESGYPNSISLEGKSYTILGVAVWQHQKGSPL